MLIGPHDLHTLARMASTGILNSLLAGIAIALLAWAVTRLCDRRGAGTRFAVWFSALVAIASLPWVCRLGANYSHSAASASGSVMTLPASFASYLFIAWIVGAVLGLLRVGLSLYRLRQLRATCTPVDLSRLGTRLSTSLAEMQAHRRVTLCSSEAVRVPAAIGYFRPMIVFPAWALQEIPAAELDAILLHELAHLRRWDDWTNLAQKIVKAVFFFHPAVWFVESRLSLEREMACDDAVLAASFSPRDYAESLIGLAERSFLRRGVELAQAAVSHVQQLRMRIVEILRKNRRGSGGVWKPAVAVMAVAGFVGVYNVSSGPHLFAFATDGSQAASTIASITADPLPTGARLQPVNLNYADQFLHRDVTTRSTSVRRVRTTSRTHVTLAQRDANRGFFVTEIAAPPMMVLSNLTTKESAAAPSAVLVVMQGEQLGMNGPVVWRLTVIQMSPRHQHVSTGGVPRKT